jgi:GT2 family glycosyltransferase
MNNIVGGLVSVIIPTHEDAELLRLALPPLLRPPANIEVIVVNNDPSQDVRAIAIPNEDTRVKVVEMGYDSGFGRAINTGIAQSSGEFVLILNADVFLTPSYIPEMLRLLAENPRAGCAGGKLYRYDLPTSSTTDVLDTAGIRIGRNRRTRARGEGQRDSGQYDVEEELFGVDGAGLFARRSALESIRIGDDYYDSSFFLHKEDTDLCWRLRLAGWEVWYVPTAIGAHARTTRGLGERSYLSAIRQFHENAIQKSMVVQIHAMKNQWLMLLKNEDLTTFVLDSPFIVARELIVLLHNLVFAPKSLVAMRDFTRLVRPALRKRRAIKSKQTTPPATIRHWLGRA